MNVTQLRDLATHHAEQALAMETTAEMHTALFADTPAAALSREKAAWHATTATELRELADAFSNLIEIIQP